MKTWRRWNLILIFAFIMTMGVGAFYQAAELNCCVNCHDSGNQTCPKVGMDCLAQHCTNHSQPGTQAQLTKVKIPAGRKADMVTEHSSYFRSLSLRPLYTPPIA